MRWKIQLTTPFRSQSRTPKGFFPIPTSKQPINALKRRLPACTSGELNILPPPLRYRGVTTTASDFFNDDPLPSATAYTLSGPGSRGGELEATDLLNMRDSLLRKGNRAINRNVRYCQ